MDIRSNIAVIDKQSELCCVLNPIEMKIPHGENVWCEETMMDDIFMVAKLAVGTTEEAMRARCVQY